MVTGQPVFIRNAHNCQSLMSARANLCVQTAGRTAGRNAWPGAGSVTTAMIVQTEQTRSIVVGLC